jgi:neutral trehalase
MNVNAVQEFIAVGWDSTVRFPADCGANELALAAPFTVPTAGQTFRFFFYWDTYFTNVCTAARC